LLEALLEDTLTAILVDHALIEGHAGKSGLNRLLRNSLRGGFLPNVSQPLLETGRVAAGRRRRLTCREQGGCQERGAHQCLHLTSPRISSPQPS
jgi:hypothetical protein